MSYNVQDAMLMNVGRRRPLATLAALALTCVTAHAAELRLGQSTTPPGTVVGVPVTCAGASGAVGAQFDVTFNPSAVSLAGIAAGAGLSGHTVDQQQLAPGHWRVLVYSMTNAPIAPGAAVWVSFSVPTNAPDGDVPLGMSDAIVARVGGTRVQPLAEVDGAVTVWSGGSFLALTQEGGGLRVWFQGIEARRYVFEASTNLTDWVVLGTNTVEGGAASFLEADLRIFPSRFYRTRLVP